jgi:hypothetical protein
LSSGFGSPLPDEHADAINFQILIVCIFILDWRFQQPAITRVQVG